MKSMINVVILFLILTVSIFVYPAFADSYNLIVDEHSFDISYEIDADVIAMDIDKESVSLLIGIENTNDGQFIITLPNDLISADSADFIVLVDGVEHDYAIQDNNDSMVLSLFVPQYSEEIEIIGTHVIPEFPFGLIFVLGSMMALPFVFARAKINLFK